MVLKILFPIILSVALRIFVNRWHHSKQKTVRLSEEYFFNKSLSSARPWGSNYAVVEDFESWRKSGRKMKTKSAKDITLITQCSVNNLHYLPEMSARWKGPVSVAVFAPKSDAVQAILGVRWLRLCFPVTLSKTDFHLVYPVNQAPEFDYETLSQWAYDHLQEQRDSSLRLDNASYCLLAFDAIKRFAGTNYVLEGIEYPHNTLRNVARKGALTDLMLVVDIDTFPAVSMREEFLRWTLGNKVEATNYEMSKTAFVVPAFEISENQSLPTRKADLLKEYKRGRARPFHSETCPYCHQATRYSEWLASRENRSVVIGFEAAWKQSWEPFYISTKDAPFYDERFLQYGFDRISQVCELYMAEYRFVVLNNAFVIHKGYKRPHEFHSSKHRENKRNYQLYTEQFIPDMKEKYPDSKRSCVENYKRRGIAHSKFRPHFKKHEKNPNPVEL